MAGSCDWMLLFPEALTSGRIPQCIRTPRDWLDAEAWDSYWLRVIDDPLDVEYHAICPEGGAAISSLPLLRERGARRVLYAGNGISLEPHAWVHAGFDVTVLDVSPAASRFVEQYGQDARVPPRFFREITTWQEEGKTFTGPVESLSRMRAERERRPGGRLTVLTENLFTHAPSESYDVLVSIRSFQGFPPEEQQRLAARFHDWLSPGGSCIVETMNVRDQHFEWVETAFRRAGFFQQGLAVRASRMRRRSPSEKMDDEARAAEREAAQAQDEAEERDRLTRGEKVFVHIPNSG